MIGKLQYFIPKHYDISFFGTSAAIFFLGLLNLYSATHASGLYKTQIMYFLVAFALGVVTSFIHPKTIFRYSYAVYFFNVFLLILVLLFGKTVYGAQRWLELGPFRLQPSELMKVSCVLAICRFYSKNNPLQNLGLKELIIPGIMVLFPAVLIIIEPDLGTGTLLLLIFLIISFYKRLKWKTIFILFFIGLASSSLMYRFGLKEYQKQRIKTFIDPWRDARGSGYNTIQSEIAIGSGQLFGKGYRKSSQASLQYLPENHTDFVFSIFNEEHGFFGSLVLVTLYAILLLRHVWLATNVIHFYESLVAIGLMSIFFWHTIINMGMVTGLLPIVGLPLPYLSYGGSSLLTFGICTGIATSISNSRTMFGREKSTLA